MNADNKSRINQVFNNFNKDSVHLLDKFYHPNVKFKDPLSNLNSLEELKKYYLKLYENVTEIKFIIPKITSNGDEYFVPWTMVVKTKKLAKDKPINLEGVSHIKFDPATNLAIFHQDHFDMGAMVYEHLPVIGWLVKKVKHKMHP